MIQKRMTIKDGVKDGVPFHAGSATVEDVMRKAGRDRESLETLVTVRSVAAKVSVVESYARNEVALLVESAARANGVSGGPPQLSTKGCEAKRRGALEAMALDVAAKVSCLPKYHGTDRESAAEVAKLQQRMDAVSVCKPFPALPLTLPSSYPCPPPHPTPPPIPALPLTLPSTNPRCWSG
jgi:hypothetical protein